LAAAVGVVTGVPPVEAWEVPPSSAAVVAVVGTVEQLGRRFWEALSQLQQQLTQLFSMESSAETVVAASQHL